MDSKNTNDEKKIYSLLYQQKNTANIGLIFYMTKFLPNKFKNKVNFSNRMEKLKSADNSADH